jgi:hypothetical protein
VNKDRLYRALDQLLPHKAALEAHLSRRVGELFAVMGWSPPSPKRHQSAKVEIGTFH